MKIFSNLESLDYPVTMSTKSGLAVILYRFQKRYDREIDLYEDVHRSDFMDGFQLFFHEPYEVPSRSANSFQTTSNQTKNYYVETVLTDVEDSLREFPPEE